jgi:hypothetical protein
MKLVHVAMIATGVVVTMGVAMIVPAFMQHQDNSPHGVLLMLSFNVVYAEEEKAASSWCRDLSSLLDEHGVRATVFVTGKIAETSPECITSFSPEVDIGSQTYNYTNLVSLGDYTKALEEVAGGKQAVDKAGKLDSRLFRAPYGSADEDIYSLLSRSEIVADFSYVNRYNKYEEGQFVRYDLKNLPGNKEGLDLFSLVSKDDDVVSSAVPVAFTFDNSVRIGEIREFLIKLDSYKDVKFVNASDLAGMDLTLRGGGST